MQCLCEVEVVFFPDDIIIGVRRSSAAMPPGLDLVLQQHGKLVTFKMSTVKYLQQVRGPFEVCSRVESGIRLLHLPSHLAFKLSVLNDLLFNGVESLNPLFHSLQ